MDLQRAFSLGLEIIETSRPIEPDHRSEDVRDVRDFIANLPVHLDKNKTFKGMTAQQAIEANIAVVDAPLDQLHYAEQIVQFLHDATAVGREEETLCCKCARCEK